MKIITAIKNSNNKYIVKIMNNLFFRTQNTLTGFILRLTLGIIFFPHGMQKTAGWFGGAGFSQMMKIFTEQMHLPTIVAFLVIMTEFVGAICLIFGFATRFWAIAYIGLMLGIMFTTHLQYGFFMNWMGTQQGEGCQFDLMAIGIALALVVEGGGKYAIDGYIIRVKR